MPLSKALRRLSLYGLCTLGCTTLAFAYFAKANNALPQAKDSYFVEAEQALRARLANRPIETQAKNIVLFVADGHGVASVTASRIYQGQQRGETGEENVLAMEDYSNFPYLALSKTYNHNTQTPDSAGTMTAIVTGVKTKQGVLSVSKDVARGDCEAAQKAELTTVLELAEQIGLSTGIVSTARLTHATSAANYAHAADRAYEDDSNLTDEQKAAGCRDIARQMIELGDRGGDGLEVALGGGRINFFPESVTDPENPNKTGRRLDNRNLAEEWTQQANSAYVWNQSEFDQINPLQVDRLLGLFNPSHMEYELDRAQDAGGEPSLSEMTEKAIQILERNPKGYFLQVESGRVDHAHHGTNAARALEDAVAFDAAVAQAVEMTDPQETLVIVTADHSHTLTLAGYAQRGNPILGLVRGVDGQGEPTTEFSPDLTGKPYPILGYANGPSAALDNPPALTDAEATDPDYLQPSLVPLGSETHSAEDVAIYARGPWAHLFQGTVEQNYIFHVMDYAAKLRERAADSAGQD